MYAIRKFRYDNTKLQGGSNVEGFFTFRIYSDKWRNTGVSEIVVRKQMTNVHRQCVVNMMCKSKITNMATMRNFEVISDMFKIGVCGICAEVITSSQIENNPQYQDTYVGLEICDTGKWNSVLF
jgi:hypothetical protein